MSDTRPVVSVIVAYFEQQAELDRTLLALARQTWPAELLDIVVVDDGSSRAPTVPPGIRLLRQDDRGFRVSAARNLGVRSARGSVLCFLDADTAPEPEYIERIVQRPSQVPEALTVGRRRHADLGSADPLGLIEQLGPERELPSPAWLSRAYEQSRDLADSDFRSYRFLIGAVLCCSRDLFDRVGGFDETFTDYGGEDWEWGYRAWLSGAELAHIPDAVAWHDGPDRAGRDIGRSDALVAWNRESLRAASAIPVPGSRGRGVRTPRPDLLVVIDTAASSAALFLCIDSVLAALPDALVVAEPAATLGLEPYEGDPRVTVEPGIESGALVRVRIDVRSPVRFDRAGLRDAVDAVGGAVGPAADTVITDDAGHTLVTISSTRTRNRHDLWDRSSPPKRTIQSPAWAAAIVDEPDLGAYLSGWG